LGRVAELADVTSGKRSLAPIAKELENLLEGTPVKFLKVNIGKEVENASAALKSGEILLLENTRYNDIDAEGNVINKESKADLELGRF
jgi:phosphoglycerate kinase